MVRLTSTGVLGATVEKRPPEGAHGRCPAALKRLDSGQGKVPQTSGTPSSGETPPNSRGISIFGQRSSTTASPA